MTDHDPAEYNVIGIPTKEIWQHAPRHALFRDHSDKFVVEARLLDETPSGDWLLSVEGEVYAMPKHTLQAALDFSVEAGFVKKADEEDDDE